MATPVIKLIYAYDPETVTLGRGELEREAVIQQHNWNVVVIISLRQTTICCNRSEAICSIKLDMEIVIK